jgi:hypothetical protein
MAVDGAKMRWAQPAAGEGFVETLGGDGRFKAGQRRLRCQVSEILEDRGARVAIGIFDGVIRRHGESYLPYFSTIVRRRTATEAPDLSSDLKVPFISALRCKPSTALIFSKLLRPRTRFLVFAPEVLRDSLMVEI